MSSCGLECVSIGENGIELWVFSGVRKVQSLVWILKRRRFGSILVLYVK